LFGNTVNVASRMESSCKPMYIQLSEDAAKVLQNSSSYLAKNMVARG
jgi:class 3 adenylate cyclase